LTIVDLVTHDGGVDAADGGSPPVAPPTPDADDLRRKKRASVIGVAVAFVPFLLVLWNFGVRPARSALPNRLFSDFFDIQSRAFLRGDLALPTGSLGFEAFRFGGREYMYFGAWPSLLRIPVLALTHRFDARLTASSMAVAWLAAALFTCLTVWRIRAIVAPARPLSRRELTAVSTVIAIVLGGSPVLFAAALPWVYSEALMWAFAATLGAVYGAIGVLERPSRKRIAFAGVLTFVAVLCRVTAGWGCGLVMLGIAGSFLFIPRYAAYRRWAGWVGAAAVIPLGIGVAINYAKFGHPVLIPFESQVWTDLSVRRRQVLDEGGVTGVRFLPSTLFNYLRPDGIRFSPIFPFITAPAKPASQVGSSTLDMQYRTPSAVALMPMLFALGVVGLVQMFKRRASAGVALLRVPLLGAASILGGALLVGYIAPRYTIEFVPSLLIASVVGIYTTLDRGDRWSRPARTLVSAALAALALFGLLANLAIATATARVAEGGGAMRSLVSLQKFVSDRTGHPLDAWVDVGDAVPARSLPDHVFIAGDCDLMLAGTGDYYEPWVPLEMRSVNLEVELGEHASEGRAVLARFGDGTSSEIAIEIFEYHYRLAVTGAGGGYAEGQWVPAEPGKILSIDITAAFDQGVFIVESAEQLYTSVYAVAYGQDAVGRFRALDPSGDQADLDHLDAAVTVSRSGSTSLCRELRGAAIS